MTPTIDYLSAQIKSLIPLLKQKEEQNVEIKLLKQDVENIKKYKISENDLTKFELAIEKQRGENKLYNERQFGDFRRKLVILAIIEKVIVAGIIYFITKG